LQQKSDLEDLHPISYFSRKLKKHETKWPALQLELFAIIAAIEHFKNYLYGRQFTIISDHKPLSYAIKLNSPGGRLSRWLLKLSEYNFKFQHIPGSENLLADYLSRDIPETVNLAQINLPDIEEIKITQRQDESLQKIIRVLEGKDSKSKRAYDQYFLDNGVLKHLTRSDDPSPNHLYYEQLVVPASLRPTVLEFWHIPHYSFQKMYKNMRSRFFWKNMYRDIKHFALSCLDCNQTKKHKITPAPLQRIEITSAPMQRLHIDVVGPLPTTIKGNKYILTITDHFSRYCHFYSLTDQSATSIAAKLMDFVSIHGIPQSILTDQGQNFQANIIKTLAKNLGIKQLPTTPYHPASNAICERTHKSIQNSLACLSKNVVDWDQYLPLYTLFYNNSYHESLKMSPAYVLFGRHLDLPYNLLQNENVLPTRFTYVDNITNQIKTVHKIVKQNLEKAAIKQEEIKNKKAKLRTFKIGEQVYLYTPRTVLGKTFSRKWAGPYVILEKNSDVNYTIKDMRNDKAKIQRVEE